MLTSQVMSPKIMEPLPVAVSDAPQPLSPITWKDFLLTPLGLNDINSDDIFTSDNVQVAEISTGASPHPQNHQSDVSRQGMVSQVVDLALCRSKEGKEEHDEDPWRSKAGLGTLATIAVQHLASLTADAESGHGLSTPTPAVAPVPSPGGQMPVEGSEQQHADNLPETACMPAGVDPATSRSGRTPSTALATPPRTTSTLSDGAPGCPISNTADVCLPSVSLPASSKHPFNHKGGGGGQNSEVSSSAGSASCDDCEVDSDGGGMRNCDVCEEKASGHYFGAVVCLPCKSFFIRCTKRGEPVFAADCGGNCNMQRTGRSRCQYCRFQKCLSAGMCRKEKPEAVVPEEGQVLCEVCSDIANGVHFGVTTCEGCKKFFRRGLKEHSSYVCKASRNCTINPRIRNNCRYCRYHKCLRMGMSREAIKMGRPKKGETVSVRSPRPTPLAGNRKLTHQSEDSSISDDAPDENHEMENESGCGGGVGELDKFTLEAFYDSNYLSDEFLEAVSRGLAPSKTCSMRDDIAGATAQPDGTETALQVSAPASTVSSVSPPGSGTTSQKRCRCGNMNAFCSVTCCSPLSWSPTSSEGCHQNASPQAAVAHCPKPPLSDDPGIPDVLLGRHTSPSTPGEWAQWMSKGEQRVMSSSSSAYRQLPSPVTDSHGSGTILSPPCLCSPCTCSSPISECSSPSCSSDYRCHIGILSELPVANSARPVQHESQRVESDVQGDTYTGTSVLDAAAFSGNSFSQPLLPLQPKQLFSQSPPKGDEGGSVTRQPGAPIDWHSANSSSSTPSILPLPRLATTPKEGSGVAATKQAERTEVNTSIAELYEMLECLKEKYPIAGADAATARATQTFPSNVPVARRQDVAAQCNPGGVASSSVHVAMQERQDNRRRQSDSVLDFVPSRKLQRLGPLRQISRGNSFANWNFGSDTIPKECPPFLAQQTGQLSASSGPLSPQSPRASQPLKATPGSGSLWKYHGYYSHPLHRSYSDLTSANLSTMAASRALFPSKPRSVDADPLWSSLPHKLKQENLHLNSPPWPSLPSKKSGRNSSQCQPDCLGGVFNGRAAMDRSSSMGDIAGTLRSSTSAVAHTEVGSDHLTCRQLAELSVTPNIWQKASSSTSTASKNSSSVSVGKDCRSSLSNGSSHNIGDTNQLFLLPSISSISKSNSSAMHMSVPCPPVTQTADSAHCPQRTNPNTLTRDRNSNIPVYSLGEEVKPPLAAMPATNLTNERALQKVNRRFLALDSLCEKNGHENRLDDAFQPSCQPSDICTAYICGRNGGSSVVGNGECPRQCHDYWLSTCPTQRMTRMTSNNQRSLISVVSAFSLLRARLLQLHREIRWPVMHADEQTEDVLRVLGKLRYQVNCIATITKEFLYRIQSASSVVAEDAELLSQQHGLSCALVLLNSHAFEAEMQSMRDLWNWTVSSTCQLFPFKAQLLAVGSKVQMLTTDKLETALLCAISVFRTDTPGLMNKEAVQAVKTSLLDGLLAYISSREQWPSQRVGRLFRIMPDVCLLSSWYRAAILAVSSAS